MRTFQFFTFSIFLFMFLSARAQNDLKWITPKGNEKIALKNQTLEIGFILKATVQQKINEFLETKISGINPYDPEQLDFTAFFVAPSGKTHRRYGFYYEEFKEDLKNNVFIKQNTKYPWRLRFAPDEVGNWKVNIVVKCPSLQEMQNFELSFLTNNSTHQGPITITKTGTEADRYFSYAQSGVDFPVIGMNISNWGAFGYKPEDNRNHMNAVQLHADQKGNFARFEIGAQNSLPDWQDMRNYTEKQDEMFAFDRLLQKAEDLEIYYIVFRHHVELIGPDWGVSNWKNNPYRKALDLKKISEYYTNPEALKWQKNNLRYLYSRWGQSPSWSFYGYSEIERFYDIILEQEGISEKEGINLVLNWYLDQKKYILDELKPTELFSNSYGRLSSLESKSNFNGFFKDSDVVSVHLYSTVKKANYEKRYEQVNDFWDLYQKPVIIEEMGVNDDKLPIYCCTKVEFHNSIWATAFMGDVGTGLDWWYDRGVFDLAYNNDLKVVSDFFQGEDRKDMKYHPQRWTDANDSKRKVESFQLVSENKERILGWLHNATYYWRNEAATNPCIQSLLDSSNLVTPCVVGGGLLVGRKEQPRDYAREFHKDYYTDNGGIQPIYSSNIIKNPTFKIENVNGGRGKNKCWYQVEFFSTDANHSMQPIDGTQIVSANLFRDLIIYVPNLDNNNPDVSFKINYIGKGKTPDNVSTK